MISFGPFQGYCPNCMRIRPYTRFQRKNSGLATREPYCMDCSGYIRANRKAAANSSSVLKIGQRLRGGAVSVPDLREMTGELIEQIGGVQKFVSRIVAAMDFAEQTDPKLFRDYCQMVMKLVEVENARRLESGELGDMSDADLAHSLKRAAFMLLQGDSGFRETVLSEAAEFEFIDLETNADPAVDEQT